MEPKRSSSLIWDWNKAEQLSCIRDCVTNCRYIAIDTEFPGCLRETPMGANGEQRFKDMRFNVTRTKLIQLGFTLFDDGGRIFGSWEVNFSDFDETNDSQNEKSMAFLRRNGLNLERIREEGISIDEFFKEFALILNEKKMNWITFHGLYDMAYLLKGFNGRDSLPKTSKLYDESVERFFGKVYDVKEMAGRCRGLSSRFGLQRVAEELGIRRAGNAHHAGSDSELTARVFTMITDDQMLYCTAATTEADDDYMLYCTAALCETVEFSDDDDGSCLPVCSWQLWDGPDKTVEFSPLPLLWAGPDETVEPQLYCTAAAATAEADDDQMLYFTAANADADDGSWLPVSLWQYWDGPNETVEFSPLCAYYV